MQLSRNTKIAIGAFLAFDLLVAGWLVYLFLVRAEVNDINELRDMGATRYPDPFQLQNIQLVDSAGTSFGEEDFLGKWSLVFFGFTSCPDVCPLTMSELDRFYSNDSNFIDTERPQVVFVTVDPGRDNQQVVGDYVQQFHDDFIGLTGDEKAISIAAQQFFVAYQVSEGEHADHGSHGGASSNNAMPEEMNPDDYRVDHNTHLSLVNPNGELEAVIRPPIRQEVMRQLYPRLVQE